MSTLSSVFITREVFEESIELLKKNFKVISNQNDTLFNSFQLLENLKNVNIVQSSGSDILDEKILSKCPQLKVISNTAVGYNNIDIDFCTKNKIMVFNTPNVLDDTVADFAILQMLSVARGTLSNDKYVRENQWKKVFLKQQMGVDFHNKKLGLIGFGRIGKKIAKRAKAFDLQINYFCRNQEKSNIENQYGAYYSDLNNLCKNSDFIVVIVPYSKETHHLISYNQISLMKKNSIIVNVARGGVINDLALIQALKEKKIYGAGIDVFENEPKINEGFYELDNVVLSPHVGSGTYDTRKAMSLKASENIISAVIHKNYINLVNKEVLN